MTVLTNINIWDGADDEISSFDAIEIEAGRIARVGMSHEMQSKNSRDMSGAYLIPGLIDAHVHMCLNPEISAPEDQDKFTRDELLTQMETRAGKMLAAGITTARDLGGGQWLELEVRDRINRDEIAGTRLICAGQPVTSPMGHCHFWGGEADNQDAVLAVIERQLAHGVDLIKVMATGGNLTKGSKPADAQFDLDTMRLIVAEAGKHGCHVAAHCHGTAGIRNAAESGVATIEHCSWVGAQGWAREYDPVVATTIAEKGVWVSPTVNLGWKRRIGSGDYEALVKGNFQRMRESGVQLIASTDAGIPNVFHHDLPRALPIFAHFAGLSNVEVLRAATSDCADAIGLTNLTGRIREGLAADFVILEASPLESLAALATPIEVYARGRPLAESPAAS